jgi:hypothetical protein
MLQQAIQMSILGVGAMAVHAVVKTVPQQVGQKSLQHIQPISQESVTTSNQPTFIMQQGTLY